MKKNKTLTSIISQLLHRSPDYVNLGEITTEEEAKAWISCVSAGIPVIQTIHSLSQEGIMPRLTQVFAINQGLISSSFPHLFIELRYFWQHTKKIRKIFSISEIIFTPKAEICLSKIAAYSLEKETLSWLRAPAKTQTFQWIHTNKNTNIDNEIQNIR